MGGDAVSKIWICVYGDDWALGAAVGLNNDHFSEELFMRILKSV
jgi:hypothetical protein